MRDWQRAVEENARIEEWRRRLRQFEQQARPIREFAPLPAELLAARPDDPHDAAGWFVWCGAARLWWVAQDMPPVVVDMLWGDLVAERLRQMGGWPPRSRAPLMNRAPRMAL